MEPDVAGNRPTPPFHTLEGASRLLTQHGLLRLREAGDSPRTPVSRLRKLAAVERSDLLTIVVYGVAIGVASLLVPVAVQSLVNTVAFTPLVQPLVVLSLVVFIGMLSASALKVLQYRVVETLQQRFFVRVVYSAAQALRRADLERAFREHGPRDLMNRFFDTFIVQKAAATLLMDGLSVLLQGGVSLVLLAFYHPALLAFDVVLIGLILFIVFGLGRRAVETAIKESKAKHATAEWLEEMAGALRTFKSPDGFLFGLRRSDALAKSYVAYRKKHFSILLRQVVAAYVLQGLATASLLGLGGYLVIRGQLSLGQLVAAELIVTAVLSNVAKMGKYFESYYDLVASLDKLGSIFDVPLEPESESTLLPRAVRSELNTDGLSFEFDRKPVLRGVSFQVSAGSCVAVLGAEASGKSTLVDLLYGLRRPSSGRVVLDGVDLRGISVDEVRERISVVGRAEVFEGTIEDNLHLGHPAIDARRVEELLTVVGLSEEVASMRDGIRSSVGPSGSRLTSSQRARLSIARALARDTGILIIDEALDAVGPHLFASILRNIRSAFPDLGVLLTTSRSEIAAYADRVVRLEDEQPRTDFSNEEMVGA